MLIGWCVPHSKEQININYYYCFDNNILIVEIILALIEHYLLFQNKGQKIPNLRYKNKWGGGEGVGYAKRDTFENVKNLLALRPKKSSPLVRFSSMAKRFFIELSNFNRDPMIQEAKNIYYLVLYRKMFTNLE